jgi:hypothetical protein
MRVLMPHLMPPFVWYRKAPPARAEYADNAGIPARPCYVQR